MLRRLSIHRTQGLQRALGRAVVPRVVSMAGEIGEPWVEYSDGRREPPGCLRCPDAPCLRYGAEELQIPGLPSFPGDGDLSVCPTAALSWPIGTDRGPTVIAEQCIGCGLCIQRCPVGAIQLDTEGLAVVIDDDTPSLKCSKAADAVATRLSFAKAVRHPRMTSVSDKAVGRLTERVGRIGAASGTKFPNLYARNLLEGGGWRAAMRRTGDTNVRMDIVAQRSAAVCVTEVEFTDAVIDAPRCVLDGIAVLRSRYGLSKASVIGLVVAGLLPNQRSEYWRVIADIETALALRVHTVTPAALVLLVWEGRTLDELPFASLDAPTIRAALEVNRVGKFDLSLGAASALEALK